MFKVSEAVSQFRTRIVSVAVVVFSFGQDSVGESILIIDKIVSVEKMSNLRRKDKVGM